MIALRRLQLCQPADNFRLSEGSVLTGCSAHLVRPQLTHAQPLERAWQTEAPHPPSRARRYAQRLSVTQLSFLR